MHPDETGGRHALYLMREDVHTTVEELTAQGVEIFRDVSDEGFGLMTAIRLPGVACSGCTSRATRARSSPPNEPDHAKPLLLA